MRNHTNSLINDDTLTREQRIQLIEEKIHWIDEHEKMFQLTSGMHLERILLKEELEELKMEDEEDA